MIPILLTRPRAAAERTAAELRADLGANWPLVISPLTRIVPLQPQLPYGAWAGVIVTSGNGAAALSRLGISRTVPVLAVGGQSAALARAAGYAATAGEGDARALAALIREAPPRGPLLHLRGAEVAGDVAGELRAAGIVCAEAVAYRQEDASPTEEARALLSRDGAVALPLYSPASARRFAALPPGQARIHVAAMSEAVAEALGDRPVASVRIAERPDGLEMHRQLRAIVLP